MMVSLISLVTAGFPVISIDAVQVCEPCVTVQLYVVLVVGVTNIVGPVDPVDQLYMYDSISWAISLGANALDQKPKSSNLPTNL